MPLRLLHHQRQQVSVYMQTAALPLALLWQSLAMNHTEHQHVHQSIQVARHQPCYDSHRALACVTQAARHTPCYDSH